MALVRHLSRKDIAHPKKRRKVATSLWLMSDKKPLHVDACGSADRAVAGMVSQSLRFDRQDAGVLRQLLQQIPDCQGRG